jgi:hypothetical protein
LAFIPHEKPRGTLMARDNRIDIFRGLTIVYIVAFIHPTYWLGNFIQNEIIRSLFLFEMPAIFIISGASYFLYSQKRDLNIGSIIQNVVDKWTRIYIPFFAYITAVFALFLLRAFHNKSLNLDSNLLTTFLDFINPFTFGSGLTSGHLLSALWFVGPYLIISASMPLFEFVSKVVPNRQTSNLPILFGIGFANTLIVQFVLNGYLSDVPSHALYYFFWAFAGFELANNRNYKLAHVITTFLMSIAAFALCALIDGNHNINSPWNMQANKFPPTIFFYLFNWLWICIILTILHVLRSRIPRTTEIPGILAPFCRYGYSIYLWQGFGYFFAAHIGRKFSLPSLFVATIAVVSSVALGKLFSPIEGIRNRKKTNP